MSNEYINLLDNSNILEILKKNGLMLKFISKDKLTKEMVLIALKNNIDAKDFIGDFNDDKDVILYVLSKVSIYSSEGKGRENLPYFGKTVGNDRDIIIASIKIDTTASSFGYSNFKDDKEVAMLAVSRNLFAIYHVSKSLKLDQELALYACECNINAIDEVDGKMRHTKDFVYALIKQTPYVISRLNSISTKMLAMFNCNDDDDWELMLNVVNYDGTLLKYLPDEFKYDDVFACNLLEKNGLLLKYFNDVQKDNSTLVLKAINQNGSAFQYASARLRNDKEVVSCALKTFKNMEFRKSILDGMHSDLKKDSAFLEHLILNNYAFIDDLVIKTSTYEYI